MEIIYGILFIYFGICLLGVSFGMINSLCYDISVCNIGGFELLLIFVLIVVGIIVLIFGIRKVTRDFLTNRKGIEKYGLVIDKVEHINRNTSPSSHYYKLTILIIEDDKNINNYTEISMLGYNVGSYVMVKHYKKDINIIDSVSLDLVPEEVRYKLENYNNNNKKI